ncbi:DUF6731 family protein [Rahnella laticis]|uniref:DUF6731 family protein n=1 Tax=Rahnella laticis TaxID=2787622 RepID=UPI0018A2CBA3|nr:DUF6731 family protein [Rahnella laticis]MBF7997759.1 hypothetical protein [Rahnella laticis]
MPTKRFYFDFYQCNTISTNTANEYHSPDDVMAKLLQDFEDAHQLTVKQVGSKIVEMRDIQRTSFGFKGILGKHRQNDLPHAAVAGGQERELTLNANENLLEKAYFHYYSVNSVLIIQKNRYCYNWLLLSKYLSDSVQNTTVNPIIQTASLNWLMRNEVRIKTLEIGIARPRNAELFRNAEHDFNNAMIATLNGSNSAKINLTLRGDGRTTDPETRYLGSNLKRAFAETFETFQVEKLKVDTENVETGFNHPLDLVADKLTHYADVEMGGRYPLSASIWEALAAAKASKEDELNAYFGLPGAQVD